MERNPTLKNSLSTIPVIMSFTLKLGSPCIAKAPFAAKLFNSSQTRKNRAVCSVISLKAVVRTRPAAICTDFRMFSVPVKNMHIKTSGIAPSVLQSPMRRSAIDLRSINEAKTARRTQAVHSASGCECPDLPLRSAAQQR